MTIHPIGADSVALYLTPTDLKEYGFTPEDLSPEQALELTRSACGEAGIDLAGSIEIEAYPGGCGILVFAQIKPQPYIWFSFECLDSLLAAARVLPDAPAETRLFWCAERWWLSLPGSAGHCANILSEFGQSCRQFPHMDARIAEYGAAIFLSHALDQILSYFPV